MSRWGEAADHFEAAIAAHDRLGTRPFLARTRYEYARMLLARGQAGDRRQADELLDQALAGASTIRMAGVAEEIQALQAAQAAKTPRWNRGRRVPGPCSARRASTGPFATKAR